MAPSSDMQWIDLPSIGKNERDRADHCIERLHGKASIVPSKRAHGFHGDLLSSAHKEQQVVTLAGLRPPRALASQRIATSRAVTFCAPQHRANTNRVDLTCSMVVRQKDNGEREALLSIVVTGAAMGIGKAVALRLARDSRALVLVDVAEEALAETAREARAAGARVEQVVGSVGQQETANRTVALAIEIFGRLDGLSHNAGIQRYGTAVTTSDQISDEVLSVNLTSAFLLARAALPELIKTRGAIVMMASVQGLATQRDVAAYTSAKHGLIGLTKSIAVDFARYG